MAIYHLSVQVISRAAGRSSVAAAAYRAGERLEDERTGLVHDYDRRQDIDGWVQAPQEAPDWVYDRQALWNQVEAAERRRDAQLARELNVALPRELDREGQQAALWDYVQAHFVDRGMIADVTLHHGDPDNPHAHIMLTMRTVDRDGFGPKVREWNDRALLGEWRGGWADRINDALAQAGREERIDHRALADQGLDRLPTIHEGPNVREMEARGLATERGDWNRAITEYERLGTELAGVKAEHEAATAARSEERAHARAERAIGERTTAWERSGFSPTAARALAGFEHDRGQLFRTRDEARDTIDRRDADLNARGQRLFDEHQALDRAVQARRDYQEATARAARQEGRGAALRRLLSPQAREDHRWTRDHLATTEYHLRASGADDPAALARREATLARSREDQARDRTAFTPLEQARAEIARAEAEERRATRDRAGDRDRDDGWDR